MATRTWWAAVITAVIGVGLVPRAVRAADSGQGSTPLADDRTLVALAVALACADAPEAGAGTPTPDATPPSDRGPELELVATVRAKALKFDVVPKTQVVFQGGKNRKTVWKTERVNLPMHPQPGVTYRDVAVRLTVTSDVDELASLLREAKKASAGIVMEPAAPVPAAPAPGGASGATSQAAPAASPPAPSTTTSIPAVPPAPAAPKAPAAPAAPPAPAAPAAPGPARTP